MVTPLDTWFAGEAALLRSRGRRLGRAPVVLRPRDPAWRRIAPGFAACAAMAASGLPFQIVADRRYDRAGDPRRLRRALGAGATVFLPQVHQVLPRLARLMVALRAGLLGPGREECSFLFLVEGRGRRGMGLHHDGAVDSFWLQLAGRRAVTLGPPVRTGTPADLDERRVGRGSGWRALELSPGSLFHLPPFTPHAVVCRGRSLALSLTWSRRRARRAGAAAPEGDVVAGRAVPRPRQRRGMLWTPGPRAAAPRPRRGRGLLWTQVPVVAGSRGAGRRFALRVAGGGTLRLPARLRPAVRTLALMPRLDGGAGALAPLVAHGILVPEDLPLRVVPADPRALDGWRFAEYPPLHARAPARPPPRRPPPPPP